jgi:uncharacterized membrane protein
MAFCTQCGSQVGDRDQFCARCGRQQSEATRQTDFLENLSERNAILLCYLPWIGWIAAICLLISTRFRGDKRIQFHAYQGLYLWVLWMLVEWVISPIFWVSHFSPGLVVPNLLHAALFCAWVFMLIKAHQGEDYHLPVLGELADRSAAEQRY